MLTSPTRVSGELSKAMLEDAKKEGAMDGNQSTESAKAVQSLSFDGEI